MNKTRRSVRKPAEAAESRPGGDRRVLRTRQALARALLELVTEKRYDAITIQNLLDRANIGRSTFYAHYRGKDDLLLTSFRRMLEGLDQCLDRDVSRRRRVAPVEELFRHVGDARSFHRALARSRMVDRVYQAGTEQLSRTIASRIAALQDGAADGAPPAEVRAQALAGALFALLRWWVDRDLPYSPERMDEMYHAIAAAGACSARSLTEVKPKSPAAASEDGVNGPKPLPRDRRTFPQA